jgi:hypothetical protein
MLISMFFVIKIFLTKSTAVINFNYAVAEGLMSRELRDKADVMIKELKEVLVPLSAEINRMKNTPENSINDDYFTG